MKAGLKKLVALGLVAVLAVHRLGPEDSRQARCRARAKGYGL